MPRILIVGGTRDAAQVATQLATLPGVEVITSVAGRVQRLTTASPQTRIGGFGGVAGLIDYLHAERIALLVDATHPFASQMSAHAAQAAEACGLPRVMLVRPAWEPGPGDRWISVESLAAAVALVPEVGRRVFLTIGRQEVAAFAPLTDLWCLMRMIDPPLPGTPLPPGTVLLERGPFTLAHERALVQTHAIDVLVSKNSGGQATDSKLTAARELGLPVVMVQRPALPAGERVSDVTQACAWVRRHLA